MPCYLVCPYYDKEKFIRCICCSRDISRHCCLCKCPKVYRRNKFFRGVKCASCWKYIPISKNKKDAENFYLETFDETIASNFDKNLYNIILTTKNNLKIY